MKRKVITTLMLAIGIIAASSQTQPAQSFSADDPWYCRYSCTLQYNLCIDQCGGDLDCEAWCSQDYNYCMEGCSQ